MTVTATPNRTEILTNRLTQLRAERDQAQADTVRDPSGDIADRATNVEATIRVSLLDERIAQLQLEIEASRHEHHDEGVVGVGDTVTLDLGDGPETFVVGSVEEALAGIDAVTPSSPLGQAILGAKVGDTVTYSPRPGLELSATIL